MKPILFSEEKTDKAITPGYAREARLRDIPMSGNPRWLIPLCLITLCYVLFVSFIMYRMSEATTQLYDYPYTVSREAREMKARLYEMRYTLPVLLASTNLSDGDVRKILEERNRIQDQSMDIIRSRYRGKASDLARLDKAVEDLREARKKAVASIHNKNYALVNEYYKQEILPYLLVLDEVLDDFSRAADLRGKEIQSDMETMEILAIVITLLAGMLIIGLIAFTSRLERKKNREIAYRENLFNLLAENVDEMFCIYARNGTVEYVSANSTRLIGLTPEALSGDSKAFHSLLSTGDSEWLKGILGDFSAVEPVEKEVSVKGRKGRHFIIRIYPIHRNGRLERHVLTLLDQTDRLAYQQTLGDALENARKANNAKSHFLSHMSHEIRTPMNAIIGMTAIALSRLEDKTRVEDCLGKIAQSSRHLLSLINDVLDMSKIEGGKLSIVHEPFNLRTTVQSLVDLIQPQARSRGLNFEIVLAGVEEEELRGDALRLNQILLNILSNAIKFTPAGGSVRMEIRQLHFKNNQIRFRFRIADTGIGMSPEFIGRLYTPFEQADTGAVSRTGGTGLGMAITKNLVSLLGGTIAVKSEVGAGTQFTVELPFGAGEHASKNLTGLDPLKVLVVDDDRDTCEHATLLLERMGLRTYWVLSGEEAVRTVIEAHKTGDDFDVCIIDWRMPEMDGLETVRRIRRDVGPDTLIIIISAYDWSTIEQEAREAGVNAFVAKPFFASSLYDALLSVTRHIKPEQAGTNDRHHHYDFSGKRILLVEDNEFNREVAVEFLEPTGAVVECAGNGREAVDKFMASEPGYYSLILMDVQMPVLNGYEATQAIRASAHDDAKTIPVLAMTANAFNDDIAEAAEAGMNAHLAKPIDMGTFYALVDEYLRHPQGGADPENEK